MRHRVHQNMHHEKQKHPTTNLQNRPHIERIMAVDARICKVNRLNSSRLPFVNPRLQPTKRANLPSQAIGQRVAQSRTRLALSSCRSPRACVQLHSIDGDGRHIRFRNRQQFDLNDCVSFADEKRRSHCSYLGQLCVVKVQIPSVESGF